MADSKAQIERINEISAIARTSWLALLGYLAFIGISLLAVEDADFFVETRRTDLPLVGVAIPTYSFFFFAPILAAALYVYLQVHLLKLWDAIADAPSLIDGRSLGEQLHPWIANDYALQLKGSGALRPRPMRWLGNLATRLLVWLAGPAVIAGFWWRSMPAHDEGLTLAIAAALLVSLYAGFTSWWSLRARMLRLPGPVQPWHSGLRRPAGIALALLLIVASWLRTEGGLDHYANRLLAFAEDITGVPWLEGCALRDGSGRQVLGHPHPDCLAEPDQVRERRIARSVWVAKLDWFTLTHENWLAGIWLNEGVTWNPLARTDLAGVELVDLPEAWRTPETARAAFRKTWCEREGLSMAVCDHPPSPDRPTPATRKAARDAWCGTVGPDARTCLAQLADLDRRFEGAWTEERTAALGNLPKLVLRGRDLRNISATQTSLIGADLGGARLEGADLAGAGLEGANLFGAGLERTSFRDARLEGADLRGARLQGADLGEARLEGANLRGARLQGANLREARMEGAALSGAGLRGANLFGAGLRGAILFEARLERATLYDAKLEGVNLLRARLEGADLREARLEGAALSGARLERADLSGARLQGANLRRVDFRNSNWAGASTGASPAHRTDFRGAQGLTQDQLDQLIGDKDTLLPDRDGLTIPSCWKTPPDGFDAMVKQFLVYVPLSSDEVRAEFLCPEGEEPQSTGTRLGVDQPYPAGHPLAERIEATPPA